MKRTLTLLILVLALGPARAYADSVTLTFDGVGDGVPVGNYYNGGAGGDLGIAFGPGAVVGISHLGGGGSSISDLPAPATYAGVGFQGPGDTMNVAAGFTTGLAFSYAAISATTTVKIWSGLNDTGTLLATLSLPATGSDCGVLAYSCWASPGITFAGTAESVDFGNTEDSMAFTNITIGAASIPTSATPEPASFVLLGSGLLGVAMVRRKLKLVALTPNEQHLMHVPTKTL